MIFLGSNRFKCSHHSCTRGLSPPHPDPVVYAAFRPILRTDNVLYNYLAFSRAFPKESPVSGIYLNLEFKADPKDASGFWHITARHLDCFPLHSVILLFPIISDLNIVSSSPGREFCQLKMLLLLLKGTDH